MKKLTVLLLALLLGLPAFALGEAPALTEYVSDFSAGTDGWYARSNGTAAIETKDGALLITGREASWNSPGRDFALEAGKKYIITAQVMQSDVDSAEFMVSAAHSKAGLESYENIGKAKANKGMWTTIKCNYTPGQYDNYILYVETAGNGTIDFSIRNFTVTLDEIIFDMTLPSLKEAYSHLFDFGCAVGQGETLDSKRMDFYASQFSIMTHGNELKPDFILDLGRSRTAAKKDDTAVVLNFDRAKPLLNYCQEHGIKVHGHVLVWHSQTPDAFFRAGYKTSGEYVTREVMLARMENYIKQVMEFTAANYPGLIVSWDVVNEAIDDSTGKLRESNWTKVVGDDFVNRAFELARKYAPADVKLYYNDYNTVNKPKYEGILALLDSLVADGNIDGYGFQCHYSHAQPIPSDIRRAMAEISGKGLRLRVSELDVTIPNTSDVNLKIQGYRYEALMRVFMEFAEHLDAVQVWGVTDDLSWKADEDPLLFDGKAKAKPAFYGVLDALKPKAE